MSSRLRGAIALLFASANLYASDITVGEITYEGTACPPGSLTISRGSHPNRLALQFDPVTVSAGKGTHQLFDSKGCVLSIPFNVPNGVHVSLSPVKYFGTVDSPADGLSQLAINYIYKYSFGTREFTFWNKWNGEQNRSYSIVVPKSPNSNPYWTPCGADFTLQVHYSISTQTQQTNLSSNLSLDSIETLEFQTARCE